jgi:anti-sigma factor RsiW
MTDHDDFFARLRSDAAPLRHQPDEATLRRIRARIQERIAAPPTVAALIASWFRPLAAAVAVVAIVAGIGLASIDTTDVTTVSADRVEIVAGGDTYVVGD